MATQNLLRHGGKCNGTLVADISGLFLFSTPSISFTPTGYVLGTYEIKERDGGEVEFFCLKCEETVKISSGKDIKAPCMVCRSWKVSTDIWVSNELPCVCSSCKEILTTKSKDIPEEISEVLSVLYIPSGTINFIKLTDILSKSSNE